MEELMQYVWRFRLWNESEMTTGDGRRVSVIDQGQLNTGAGPDFFNAKVRIDDHVWAGNVEIHVRASDWYRHGHDKDRAYDNVILHVVSVDDCRLTGPDGEEVAQVVMKCEPNFSDNYHRIMSSPLSSPACRSMWSELPPLMVTDWLTALGYERVQRKADDVHRLVEHYSGDWNEAIYVTLARALGFGVNSGPMEMLARSVPLKILLKHADNPLSVNALLFGMAGFLDVDGDNIHDDFYWRQLRQEFEFLKIKFSLAPTTRPAWQQGCVRPTNKPHRRLAQLASAISHNFEFRSRLLGVNGVDEARALFDIEIPEYWRTHYDFGHVTERSSQVITRSTRDLLIINVVVPIIYAYADDTDDEPRRDFAVELLHDLRPESNSIVTFFDSIGVKARDAFDSQALIELRKEYCAARKCLFCRVGHRMLATKAVKTRLCKN